MEVEDYTFESCVIQSENNNIRFEKKSNTFSQKSKENLMDEDGLQTVNQSFKSNFVQKNDKFTHHSIDQDLNQICLESNLDDYMSVYDDQPHASAVSSLDSVKVYVTEESPPSNFHLYSDQINQKEQNKPPKPLSPEKTPKCFNLETVDGIEQTPLMFSRDSSLGSFSDYDLESPFNVKSSIASEASVYLDDLISPSDFPDSPVGANHQINWKKFEKKKNQNSFLSDENYTQNFKNSDKVFEATALCKNFYSYSDGNEGDNEDNDEFNDDDGHIYEQDSEDEIDRAALTNCWAAGFPPKKIEIDLESCSSNESVQIKDNLLLAKCLAAGLPKVKSIQHEIDCCSSDENNSLKDRHLIAKCFVASLPPRKSRKKEVDSDLSDDESDTYKDRYLIAKCLFAGLPKKLTR